MKRKGKKKKLGEKKEHNLQEFAYSRRQHIPKPPTESKQEIETHYQMHFPCLPGPGPPGVGQGYSGPAHPLEEAGGWGFGGLIGTSS